MQGSIAAFGHNKLCATFLTNISLSNLIGHLMYLLTDLNPKHEIWVKHPFRDQFEIIPNSQILNVRNKQKSRTFEFWIFEFACPVK